MSETIEVKKDIEVMVICNECGEEIEFCGSADHYGDIKIEINQHVCGDEG